MRYGTVCSGIEAPSMAWHGLGWEPVFFSEIEKHPSRVLAHHYPHVPNHGDMTKFKDWPDHAIDLLCGGTPCQSFSVAGLRKGLADPRGNLALVFLAIVDRYRPTWVVWENVPGVLSSVSHDAPDPCEPPPPLDMGLDGQEVETEDEYDSEEFHSLGCFLAGLSELGYGVSYAVRDAQYVRVQSHPRAVPQRRRRLFACGHLGDWRRAAAVLFERESFAGHPPPRRKAGQGAAPTIASRPTGGGGLGTDFDCDGGLVAFGGNNTTGSIDVATARNAHGGGSGRLDFESETFVAHTLDASFGRLQGCSGQDANHGHSHLLPIAIQGAATRENPSSGPDGIGVRQDGAAYTLEARQEVQAVAFDTTQITSPGNYSVPKAGDACHPLAAGAHPPAIAFDTKGTQVQTDDIGSTPPLRSMNNDRSHPNAGGQLGVATQWAVRRLTPLECQRLQGFPDDYFDGLNLADGPKYKMLGNSMAVNVMRWIGERIASAHAITEER